MATTPLGQLPRYTGPSRELRTWADELCSRLETWSRTISAPVGEQWIVNGTAVARDVDPAVVTTVGGLVNVVGTLVQDLAKGAPLSVT